ncbi:MAG TPA: hypothetical protein VK395_15875 [Gemmataceae bacterium]|nr:hypothetical protein [Gemmataceae bacterium]
MIQQHWILNRPTYERYLQSSDIGEPDYLSAMEEIATAFPRKTALEYYEATATRLGAIGHFDLLPYPNERLPYNPIPILLSLPPSEESMSQLLYLGMALRDFKKEMGRTDAFNDLISSDETLYRGALFEIEVGAALVRGALKPIYSTTSPDFTLRELPLGIEATMREVPLRRAVAERLRLRLALLDFQHLSIVISAKGERDIDELAERIAKDVKILLDTKCVKSTQPDYCISCSVGDLRDSGHKTVEIQFEEYPYGETLSLLIHSLLKKKEEKIEKATAGKPQIKCVAALDARSLLAWPSLLALSRDSENDYERRMAERHRHYFDWLRALRQDVLAACQKFVAQSHLIKGVMLWERKSTKSLADKVHRRYAIRFLTARQNIELNQENLSAELARIVDG